MKTAVIGTGGIGGYFGGRLAAAGHDVRFVARGGHLEALRREGLTVEGPDGGFTLPSVRATDDTHGIGTADFVLLAVKTWQLEPALRLAKPLVGPDTGIVTLQNGVEAPERVAEVFGREAVLPGVAKIIARLSGPGRVQHVGGEGSLTLGEWDGRDSERVRRLRAALTGASVKAPVTADVRAELWAKFLFVVPFGSLGAVTDSPFGVLRSRAGTRALLTDGMREIERLAAAAGVRLPEGVVASTLDFIDAQPAHGTSSLQRDILAGLPSELEDWTGSVVRLGTRHDVPTPVHRVLYEVLRLREERGEQQW
ncbi:2-dehydropantoate 2-reductase [Streptomyces sp. SID13726]|uniref:2-dehydropantoate 2-reductase n=1 Tax=Streptomyces sp. SID13726 TaxID=2706058 RepID=UPI0013B7DECC|nr:2-dehydropantoate 2-reductase [Streptomyces sp. SID13726]